MSWHPFQIAKEREIAFHALLRGGASEVELALV
jgi:hypothetical protein